MTKATNPGDDWVGKGVQLQAMGDLQRAELAYRQALGLDPCHPSALHRLGVLMRRLGRQQEAESLLRRSLEAAPRQPPVWNHLGNLLVSDGRLQEGVECFDEALAIDPVFSDAHFNRSRALRQSGRLDEALLAIQKAGTCGPSPRAPLLHLEALVRADQGDVIHAVRLMQIALQMEPDKLTVLHDLATLYQRAHRPAQALSMHERAVRLGLDVADAHYNHGNTLQSLGRLEEASAAYRRALQKEPGHRLALYDLARLRWRQADPAFDAELQAAGLNLPKSAVAPGLRAQLLMNAERWAPAADAFRQALALAPDGAGFRSGLARCLARLGDMDLALFEHDRAVSLAPRDATVRACQCAALLEARQPERASQAVQVARELAPDDQYVLALQGLVWRVMGDPRESWLNDIDRLVRVVDLEPPAGFASMADFNAALTQELESLHQDVAAPVDQTLRKGTQTLGDIFEQGHPLVDLLKARIAEAIDAHIRSLPEDPTHPFLKRRASSWRFTDSWSSRLGQGGFHTNHVHPHGWLSSAYYVQVPAAAADPVRREGWLQFGEPDFDAGLVEPVRRRVQPKPGRLALFPSLMWHGTTPFADPSPRMTIAFDVMPGHLTR